MSVRLPIGPARPSIVARPSAVEAKLAIA